MKRSIAVCLVFLLSACAAVTPAPEEKNYKQFINAGDELPVSLFTSVNGERLDWSANKSKKLLVLFATWCSDSQRAMAALNESDWAKSRSIEIIAVAREQNIEEVAAWKSEKGIQFPLVADSDRSIYSRFAEAGIPRFIVIDENNKVVKHTLAEGQDQLSLISWE